MSTSVCRQSNTSRLHPWTRRGSFEVLSRTARAARAGKETGEKEKAKEEKAEAAKAKATAQDAPGVVILITGVPTARN